MMALQMKTAPAYYPKSPWCKHDFSINKHYWRKVGIESAYEIRSNNLVLVRQTLCKHGIKNWLQGRTMQGIYLNAALPDDHDDDMGVFIDSRSTVLSDVRKELEANGFKLIRDTDGIISFERDFRYIDICLFQDLPDGRIGYSRKAFDKKHFSALDKLTWNNVEFDIPCLTDELLDNMYPIGEVAEKPQKPSRVNKEKKVQRARKPFPLNYLGLIKSILLKLIRLVNKVITKRKKIRLFAANKLLALESKSPRWLAGMITWLYPLCGIKLTTLSQDDFLNLLIEPEDSFNWGWRIRHLGPVTANGEYKRIKDVVDFLSNSENVKAIESSVEETDTSYPFFPPTNYDMRFWWGGNNYFWYCVKYQFRKNVVPYSEANNYIISGQKPLLYTKEYYEALPEMTDNEIKRFLQSSPIEITDGAVTSGKHRAFAMIGRLSSGKPYIPIKTTIRKKP